MLRARLFKLNSSRVRRLTRCTLDSEQGAEPGLWERFAYLFESFEQPRPLVLYALSGLLLQLPQQRRDCKHKKTCTRGQALLTLHSSSTFPHTLGKLWSTKRSGYNDRKRDLYGPPVRTEVLGY